MSSNSIPQWKSDRCKWCSLEYYLNEVTHEHWDTLNQRTVKCTAPTAYQYIAELESNLKAALIRWQECGDERVLQLLENARLEAEVARLTTKLEEVQFGVENN